MTKGVLKWLASLGTGAASVVLMYLQANATDPNTPIEGVDAVVSFILISLVTKGVTWLTSLLGPKPPATT